MVAMLRTRAAAPWSRGLARCWLSSLRDWSCARARAWLVGVGGWEVVWNRGLATPCRSIRE
jgi:hypothetical protein